MRKSLLGIAVLCGLMAMALAGIATANNAVDGDAPAMVVSPSVVVLAKVSMLTVHTNIPASSVVASSVTLDGVGASSTGVDNLGHLVAKFSVARLNLSRGMVTLTLRGDYKAGGSFSASDMVRVQ